MGRRNNHSYYSYGRRRKSRWPKIIIILLILLVPIVYYLSKSPRFEGDKPQIIAPNVIYSSSKKPIEVTLQDNHLLGSYKAFFTHEGQSIMAGSGKFDKDTKKVTISIPVPKKLQEKSNDTKWKLVITAKGKSLWSYIYSDSASKTIDIIDDKNPPSIKVIAMSDTIARGGSALVIFEAKDDNLKNAYISIDGIKFEANSYVKDGYFATLIAWPFKEKYIKIYIVATDTAGNKSKKEIRISPIRIKYKSSNVRVSDRFINGIISQISSKYSSMANIKNNLKKFKAVNETLRIRNEKTIYKFTKDISKNRLLNWSIKSFYPLKHAKQTAGFGTKRYYFYKNGKKIISKSYHLGYDLASVWHAPIISSNSGTVVYAKTNGIYGKMLMINHGFGLYTIYGQCSSLLVNVGDKVTAGEKIARTGKTGLALGDHLYFGVLVHGIEVWPMDWMKKNWIKKNIQKVFEKANKIIGK